MKLNSIDKDKKLNSWEEEFSTEITRDLRKKHISPAIRQFFSANPLKIVRTQAQYLYDDEGHQYLDCINNVAHVGHCHPTVAAACQHQLTCQNTNIRFLHDSVLNLSQRLLATLPDNMEICYFTNSGSESNDLALTLARYYTGSNQVIVLDHAYHGHTQSVMDISPHKFNNPRYPFGQSKNVHVVSTPDVYRGKYRRVCDWPARNNTGIETVESKWTPAKQKEAEQEEERLAELYADEILQTCKRIVENGDKVGIFLVESMQGCGGQIQYPKGYLKLAFDHVHAFGGVVLCDEVQTGFGRIGSHMWAFQLEDVQPDLVTIGKAMGNGFPVSGLITTRKIAEAHATGPEYFNTFGGNAASCAVVLAVLDTIEQEELMANAQTVGSYLIEEFWKLGNQFHEIGDVRGSGFYLGVELVKDRHVRNPDTKRAEKMVEKMRHRRIIVNNDGPNENVIKLKPPMCFSMSDADRLLANFKEILLELRIELSSDHLIEDSYYD